MAKANIIKRKCNDPNGKYAFYGLKNGEEYEIRPSFVRDSLILVINGVEMIFMTHDDIWNAFKP